MSEYTISLGVSYEGEGYVDAQPYACPWDNSNPPILELWVRSGNPATDGLHLSTVLARLNRKQVEILRNRLNEILA